ncbi:hypothetical protein Hanom_Chr16g01462431 [Helianthus anomalus]
MCYVLVGVVGEQNIEKEAGVLPVMLRWLGQTNERKRGRVLGVL